MRYLNLNPNFSLFLTQQGGDHTDDKNSHDYTQRPFGREFFTGKMCVQHLGSHKSENRRQAIVQVVEALQETGKREVQ